MANKSPLRTTIDHSMFKVLPPNLLSTALGNQIQHPHWCPVEILLAIELGALTYSTLEHRLANLQQALKLSTTDSNGSQHNTTSSQSISKIKADINMLQIILKFMTLTKYEYDWNKCANNTLYQHYAPLQHQFDEKNVLYQSLTSVVTTRAYTKNIVNTDSTPTYHQYKVSSFLDSSDDEVIQPENTPFNQKQADQKQENKNQNPSTETPYEYNPYSLFSLFDPSVGLRYLRAYSDNLAVDIKQYLLTPYIFDDLTTPTTTANSTDLDVQAFNQHVRTRQQLFDKVKYTVTNYDLPFACVLPLNLAYTPSYLFDLIYDYVNNNYQLDQVSLKFHIDSLNVVNKSIAEYEEGGVYDSSPEKLLENTKTSQANMKNEQSQSKNAPLNKTKDSTFETYPSFPKDHIPAPTTPKIASTTTIVLKPQSILTLNLQQHFPHIAVTKYASYFHHYSSTHKRKYIPHPTLLKVVDKMIDTLYYRFETLYPHFNDVSKPQLDSMKDGNTAEISKNGRSSQTCHHKSPNIHQFFPFKHLSNNEFLDDPYNTCPFCQEDTQAHNLRLVGFYNSIAPSSPYYNHAPITIEDLCTTNINPYSINNPMLYTSLLQAHKRAQGAENSTHMNGVLEQTSALLLYVNYLYFHMNYTIYITGFQSYPSRDLCVTSQYRPSVSGSPAIDNNSLQPLQMNDTQQLLQQFYSQLSISPLFQHHSPTDPLHLLAYPTGTYGQWVFAIDLVGFSMFTDNNPYAAILLGRMLSHYPERLSKALLIDPGFVFNAMWNVLKVLLDAKTSSKVEFIKYSAIAQDYQNIYNDVKSYHDETRAQIDGKYNNPHINVDEEEEEEYCSQNEPSPAPTCDPNTGYNSDVNQWDVVFSLLNAKDKPVVPTPVLVNTLNHQKDSTTAIAEVTGLHPAYKVNTLVNINEFDIDNKLRENTKPIDQASPIVPLHHKKFQSIYRYNQGLMHYPYVLKKDQSLVKGKVKNLPPQAKADSISDQHGQLSSISIEMFVWLSKECLANRNELNINNTLNVNRITYLDHFKFLHEYDFENFTSNVKPDRSGNHILYRYLFQQQSISTIYTRVYEDVKKTHLLARGHTNSSTPSSLSNDPTVPRGQTQHIEYLEMDHVYLSYINSGEFKHYWLSQLLTYDDCIELYETQMQLFQSKYPHELNMQTTTPPIKHLACTTELKKKYLSYIPTTKDEVKANSILFKHYQAEMKKYNNSNVVFTPLPHDDVNMVFAHDARCAPSLLYSGAAFFGM